MKQFSKFFIVILTFIVLETVSSQSPITFTAHLSVDNYLKDRLINKIDRDENGVFWLLESAVIQRYDGRYVTEKIPHTVVNPKYFKCLSDNTILIISHESEIFVLDKEEKILTEFDSSLKDCENCQLFDVNLIEERLWLYYRKGDEIHLYSNDDRKNSKFETVINVSRPEMVSNLFKVNEVFLVLTKSEEVYELKNGMATKMELSPLFREVNASVTSNYISKDELYFSLSRRNGTYLYKNEKLQTVTDREKLVFAKQDIKGRILLALSESFRHSEDVRIISGDSTYKWPEITEINQTYIDAFVEDLEDKLLLSSHVGLYFVELDKLGIDAYHQSSSLASGFGNVIMSFAQLPSDEIFYVKENKGIFKFEELQDPEPLPMSDQLLNNLNCRYDPVDKHLWVGGYTNSRRGIISRVNLAEQTVDPFEVDRPIMFFSRINEDELLLSSSIASESYLLRFNTKKWKITDTVAVLQGERSRKFVFYKEDKILVSTNKRLLTIDLDSGERRTILAETQVQTVSKISDGYAVCTIGKGVIFLNDSLDVIKQVLETNGLTNNQVYSVTEDQEGRFWIGTGRGLNVLDSEFRYIKSFREYEGLSSYELNTNASILLRDGNLLFGTINGVTKINPTVVLTSPESAILNIPQISYSKDGNRVLQNIENNTITVPSDATDFSFILEKNDFYKYANIDNPIAPRISVFPSDLNFELSDNRIHIPKLNSSTSKLSVYPANPYKARNKITLTIHQQRNFQPYLLTLGILALAGLVSYFIASKIIRFNKKRDQERRENEVKMAELELQALRSQMNPHFIFNSLGAILLYLQTNEKKKAEKYLTKFAKLMRMFLESSKSKFISYQEEKELLELYLELEKLRFEDKFNYELTIDPRIDKNALSLPSMLLQPFVENAINHGLYHRKGKDGLLCIKMVPDGEFIKNIISDNGIGREKARQIKEQSLKKHKSRATEIIQERIEVLKSEKNIDIDITYKDLESANGEPAGTEVIITVPKLLK